MKKSLLILLMAFLQSSLLFAQAKTSTRNDPEAKKILDAVSAKFKSFATVQASFTYKVENAAG